jgi:hypothetical protein
MKKSREIHDNRTGSHHVSCHWLTACSFLPSHLSTDLHMRLINFCLDSSHEISINAPQFRTWDWSSALILHMRLINFYLDSSMKFQSMRLNSAHEIDHLPWFFTWDWSICLDSSHEIDQFLSWFFTWNQSICLNSTHELDHLPWFFT